MYNFLLNSMNQEHEVSQSPVPKKKEEAVVVMYDFKNIVMKLTEGKKIHKLEWKDKEYYGYLDKELLFLHKPDGKNYGWIISLADLSGTDWIVL